jgi:hypothetical protein
MPMTPTNGSNSLIAALYNWGARLMGAILLIGIGLQVLKSVTAASDSLIPVWSSIALIGLWSVPVLSLTIAGVNWVVRDRRDWTGWMAIGISVFLSSLWILK